jgi:hypothetical protein
METFHTTFEWPIPYSCAIGAGLKGMWVSVGECEEIRDWDG